MNKRIFRLISALLIASLLLTGTAFMEEAPVAEPVEAVEQIAAEAEPAEEIAVEAQPAEEIATEDVELPVEEEVPVELEEVLPEVEVETEPVAEEAELTDLMEEPVALDEAEEPAVIDEAAAEELDMLAAPGTSVALNATNFPDEAFRNYLKEFDENKDGTLSEEELLNITSLQFSEWNESQDKYVVTVAAKSLTGIDLLTELEYLSIDGLGLTSLDLSKNTNLIGLYASQNKLTKLDVSNNTKLESLWCDENALTSLDVSKLTNLTDLCCAINQLTSLNVSNNTKLETLYCWDNKLTSLDVTKNTQLTSLSCESNQLSTLDVTNCTKLKSLCCFNNKITTLDISKCPTIAANVKGTGERLGDIVSFNDGKENWWLECDSDITLIGGSATLVPVVSVPKSMKYTATANVKFKIDPNGTATGFKSSKAKVATVDANGIVSPWNAGKAKITFKVGKKKRTLTVTVVDPTIPGKITLDKSGTIQWYKQDALTLNVTLPSGTYSAINWKSSNKKVAAVANGKLTFKKAGSATITATAARNKKAKAKVKIKVIDGSKATAIKINTPSTTTLKVGEKLTLTASATIARPVDPSKPTVDPKATWKSSNKKVLTINKTTGEIIARKPGTATITVTAGSKKKAKIKITVTK